MLKFLTNHSLRKSILITSIFFSTIIFAFTIFYLSFQIKSKTKADSKAFLDEFTRSNSIKICGKFNEVMSITRTLSYAFVENRDEHLETLNPANKNLLKSVLLKNHEFISVWFDWEISVVDSLYKKKNGRIANIIYRKGESQTIFDRKLIDTTDATLEGDYYTVRETKKEMMGEPYYDEINAELSGILMLSPAAPLIIQDKFVGMVGIDLDMREIQKTVRSIRPYKHSVSYLISPEKAIVAHTNESNHNKNLFSVYANHKDSLEKAIKEINSNQSYSFIYKDNDGNEVYVSMFPLAIGRDNEMWALATETPLNEILARSQSIFYYTLLIGFIGLIILGFVIYFILDNLIKRLDQAIKHSEKIAQGDLSSQIEVEGNNEIAHLGISLNHMIDTIKSIVFDIRSVSAAINSTSTEINTSSSEISESAISQAGSVEEVMASIEEMSSNIANSATNAKETESISEKALVGINSGSISVHNTVESIKKMAENISIIQEISHQTNILALNAAVEAARAGDYGKGFSVVANEVKKLAEKAQEASKKITSLALEGVTISNDAQKELKELIPDVEKTAKLVREISNGSIEQSHGTAQIQNAVQELNSIAQKNAMHSEQLSIKAGNLLRQAEQLEQMIDFFKL